MPLFTFEKPPELRKVEGIGVIFGIVFSLAVIIAWPYGFMCLLPAIAAWIIAFADWLPE